MTTLNGTGIGNGAVQQVFSLGVSFYLLTVGDTLISADSTQNLGKVVIHGSGFTWTSSVFNGSTFYQLTGGTITSVDYSKGLSSQTWSGFSVPAADAFNALLDFDAFNSLFFGGDDVFNWNLPNTSGNSAFLYGFGGNDTFNIGDWNNINNYRIEGGTGTDTLNLTGGVTKGFDINYNLSSLNKLFSSHDSSNFELKSVEIVKLAAGYDYALIAGSGFVMGSDTTVIDGSALGAANHLIFGTYASTSQFITGNLNLIGGAGDDVLQGGLGNTIYDGGVGGNDTVIFNADIPVSHGNTGVTADLSIATQQNFGNSWGTGTFISIENLVGTDWNDTLIGNAADNFIAGRGGDDAIDGGAGFDTAVFSGQLSDYTITYNGNVVTVDAFFGLGDTLVNVEAAQFADQTIRILGPVVTTANSRIAAGQTLALSSLFTAVQLGGGAITRYQLWDSTGDSNSGHFVVNGTPRAAGTLIDISAAQLAQTSFVTGSVTDTLQIRAYDGSIWSAGDNASWSPFKIGPTVNVLPVVSTPFYLSLQHDRSFGLSGMFSVSDADNDTIIKYQLLDSTSDPNSGHFEVNGTPKAAGTIIEITAAQLAQTTYVTGTVGDTLQFRAFDGLGWSAADNAAWATLQVYTQQTKPTAFTQDHSWLQGQTVGANQLVNYSDTESDPMVQIQFWDGTSDPNSGHFVVNGVAQGPGLIDLTPAQFAQTSFVLGTVADKLQVRVFDGWLWSAADNAQWSQLTVTPAPNNAPLLFTNDVVMTPGQSTPVSGLINVIDFENDPILKYQLWDGNADPNSGYFVVNGTPRAARTLVEVTAAQMVQTTYVAGTVADTLQIRAFDGHWSAGDNASWAPFRVGPPPNHAPIVETFPVAAAPGQSLPLANLITAYDPDNSATISKFQLWDGTANPNSGHFVVNGVHKSAGTVIEISVADLANTVFLTGTVADTLQVRAFDGQLWSAGDNASWAPFTVSPPVNHAPVVTRSNWNAQRNQTLVLANIQLVSASDPDNDTITKYQLWDSNADPNSGHWEVAGVAKAARTVIEITAAQFAQTTFVTGTAGDDLQVRAFDGQVWSAGDNDSWAPFTVSVPNQKPSVTTVPVATLPGQTVVLSSLFTVTDPDGDAMTKYRIVAGGDLTFRLNGVAQPLNQEIEITAAQVAQATFVMGSGNYGGGVEINAFDGNEWAYQSRSGGASWPYSAIHPHVPPVVTTTTQSLPRGQDTLVTSLFTVSDYDNDPIQKYQFWDSTADSKSGNFVVNGVVRGAGTLVEITAAQLGQTFFRAGTASGDNLQVRAFDGYAWSAGDNASWAPFHVSVPANHAPAVSTANKNANHGQSLAFSSLLSVSDSDNDPITQYQLWDGTNDPLSGYFVINGTPQAQRALINVSAAQFAQTSFVAGAVNDGLQIRAFDGSDWSAGDNASWSPFTVTVPAYTMPAVSTSDKTAAHGQNLALSSLLTVSDPDGDTITKYQLWDGTADPLSGHFMINGAAQPERALIEITAAQFAQTSFLVGTHDDNLQIRTFDGYKWSAGDNASWAPFHVTAT